MVNYHTFVPCVVFFTFVVWVDILLHNYNDIIVWQNYTNALWGHLLQKALAQSVVRVLAQISWWKTGHHYQCETTLVLHRPGSVAASPSSAAVAHSDELITSFHSTLCGLPQNSANLHHPIARWHLPAASDKGCYSFFQIFLLEKVGDLRNLKECFCFFWKLTNIDQKNGRTNITSSKLPPYSLRISLWIPGITNKANLVFKKQI